MKTRKITTSQIILSAMIAGMFLFSGMVSAQRSYYTGIRHASVAMLKSLPGTAFSVNATVNKTSIDQEMEMEMESWMTDPAAWDVSGYYASEGEEELRVEDWMFEIFCRHDMVSQAEEQALALEDWMTDPDQWR